MKELKDYALTMDGLLVHMNDSVYHAIQLSKLAYNRPILLAELDNVIDECCESIELIKIKV